MPGAILSIRGFSIKNYKLVDVLLFLKTGYHAVTIYASTEF